MGHTRFVWKAAASGLRTAGHVTMMGRVTHTAALAARIDAVFAADRDGLLYDHRNDYPWLTGALGDPYADAWFLAENPSLAQMERAVRPTPESQWNVSRADKLFRRMLVDHGFKDAPSDAVDGWHCYITDVVKSAARAGEFARQPVAQQLAIAEEWAPVLRWELEQHRPLLCVSVGKGADQFLTHLESRRCIPRLPERRWIYHYSYVARFGHEAEYRAQFEAITVRARELGARDK